MIWSVGLSVAMIGYLGLLFGFARLRQHRDQTKVVANWTPASKESTGDGVL